MLHFSLIVLNFLCFGLSSDRNVFGQDRQKKVSNQNETTRNVSVCQGTKVGLAHTDDSSKDHRYEQYKAKYTNCTYVDGNLELVFLTRQFNYDLSFLRDIREVTGYVLIASVFSDFIPLTNLQIIRGHQLFPLSDQNSRPQFSLYVVLNYDAATPGVGLKELRWTSLHEIVAGDVFFHNNRELCFDDTIEWNDILPKTSNVNKSDLPSDQRRTCPSCPNVCTFNKDKKRHCWGSQPSMCQSFTRLSCSPQCDPGRCSGDQPKDCCDIECAAGCTAQQNCFACKNFVNEGECVNSCPEETIYDKTLYKHVPNPDAKYSYGSLCVTKCPSHLIAHKGKCVKECSSQSINVNGKCVECDGPCPKTCPGVDDLNADNVINFSGCTIILGDIRILTSFVADSFKNISAMSVDQLFALESVQEVTGFIMIQAKHPNFTSLSFLRNLRIVHGRNFISGTKGTTFQIFDTNFETLDLVSLKNISNGNIVVANNEKLCFANKINWTKLVNSNNQKIIIQQNKNETECEEICSSECSSDGGCWGGRDDQCFSCAHFRLQMRCIKSCDSVPLVYQSGALECKPCHPECKSKCSNNQSDSCDECRNVRDGPYCVDSCPIMKYPDQNKICQSCHVNCDGGCTGYMNSVGLGACNSCFIGKFELDEIFVRECLPPDSDCKDGFYKEKRLGPNYGSMKDKQGCKRCHHECQICDGPGMSESCLNCVHFREDKRCVAACSSDHYFNKNNVSDDDDDDECLKCDQRCLQCTGPSHFDCILCKEYLVYLDDQDKNKGFMCMENCPDNVPDKMAELRDNGEMITICTYDEIGRYRKNAIIIGCVVGGFILMTIIIMIIVVVMTKRANTVKKTVDTNNKMFSGNTIEMEPVSPSGIKPDLATIRTIRESELSRGGILGSGAFGTVYKGLWIPENENVKMIVAIKVLIEGTTTNQNEEILSEARIMASVEHDHCIRIVAFCMTSQMMIITDLMPLGCLLEYVQNNKLNINSKMMLNWCTQIAKGMNYLEEKCIVHRDLAARNVLVQEPDHIRITDFGLSKLLDCNENVVKYTGGKMPIKWLALESIQQKLFTHKSDVWSYGVTLWELFTYGKRPYENVDAKMVPDLLEKGERLPHPSICTIDVYMICIKCWMIEAKDRPHFRDLEKEFARMMKDSNHYIILENENKMFLPKYVYDEKAVLRSLSLNGEREGPETIVSADDYIKPRKSHFSSSEDQNAANGIRREKKRQKKNSSPSKKESVVSGERRKNSRYCSDPCKNSSSLENPTTSRENYYNAIEENRMFSSEDDDYLQPQMTSSTSEQPIKYLDLKQSDTETDDEENKNEKTAFQSVISNPEYFDDDFYPAANTTHRIDRQERTNNKEPLLLRKTTE